MMERGEYFGVTPDGDIWGESSPVESVQNLKNASSLIIPPNPDFPEVEFKPRPPRVAYPREGNYAPPTPAQKLRQLSMKFIPLALNDPKVTDRPYLFKVPGFVLSYATPEPKRVSIPEEPEVDEDEDHLLCIPRPQSPPTPPPASPIKKSSQLGLRCPDDLSSLRTRAHQNFLMTYVDYTNKLEAGVMDIDPNLPCAPCCRLPKRPRPITDEEILEVQEEVVPEPLGEGKWAPPTNYVGPVAFFPDFDSLFREEERRISDEIPGWMDADEVFHPAVMGDALPPNAVIGSMDKDGVFHRRISVKDGVMGGNVGVRMANTDVIGPYLGDLLSAFTAKVEEPEQTPQKSKKKSVLVGDDLDEGVTAGYIDEQDGTFHPLEAGEEIPSGGHAAIQEADGRLSLVDAMTGLVTTDSDDVEDEDNSWWNDIPEGAIRGYIDENGVFHPLKPGEKIPPGGRPAYQTADGDVILVNLTAGQDSGQESRGSVDGYIDADGNFHVLGEGEEIPPGGIPAHRSANGQITRLDMSEAGQVTQLDKAEEEGRKSGSYEYVWWEDVPKGATAGYIEDYEDGDAYAEWDLRGYMDELGEFHAIKKGEKIAEGGRPAYQKIPAGERRESPPIPAGESPVSQPIPAGGSPVSPPIPAGGSPVSQPIPTDGSPLSQPITEGGRRENQPIQSGERPNGQPIPAGERPVTEKIRAGLDSPKAEGKVVSLVVTSGQVPTDNLKFHALNKNDKIPQRGLPAYQLADGTVVMVRIPGQSNQDVMFHHVASDGASRDTEGNFLDTLANDIDKYLRPGSKVGHVGPDGKFHELTPGEAGPPGTGLMAFIGTDGKVHTIPQTTELGFVNKDGQFVTLLPGESAPVEAQAVGYRKSGTFHVVHAPNVQQYRDKEGAVHAIVAGEVIPEGAIIMSGVAGYLDKTTFEYTALKPGESLPEGAILTYRPEDTGNQIPSGGIRAYRDVHGVIHHLAPGEEPPKGTRWGWLAPDGTFHLVDGDGEEVDLRGGVELTAEEKAALEDFTRSLGIQVEMERFEGSLDLGDVFRKTFRIYSHGGSVDIEAKPEPPHSPTMDVTRDLTK